MVDDEDTATSEDTGDHAWRAKAENEQHDRDALVDTEIAELRQLLDHVDGLTHTARERLRRIQAHRRGIDPHWTAGHL